MLRQVGNFLHRHMDTIFVTTLAVIAVTLLIVTSSCTPAGTRPFEPTATQDVAEEQQASLVEGSEAPYSGMDCLKYIRWQIAYCAATISCTDAEYSRLKRTERRLDKGYRSACLYSRQHIEQVFREFNRGSRGL